MRKYIHTILCICSVLFLSSCERVREPQSHENTEVVEIATEGEKTSEIATERVSEVTEDVSEDIRQITVTAAPQVVRDLKKKHEEVTTEDHTGEINADGYGWVQLQYSAQYHIIDDHLTRSNGVVYFMGHRETWYSTNEASGKATAWSIPGKHVADDGTIRDEDGFICVASSDHRKHTIVMTSVGPGKVYDTGCSHGTVDVYTDW
jgi:hypothetical protein